MNGRAPDWGFVGIAVALIAVLAMNVVEQRRSAGAIEAVRAAQRTQLATARIGEAQLNALAKGTRALAVEGNDSAREIMKVLNQNGIHVAK
jgi:hypothetical protein